MNIDLNTLISAGILALTAWTLKTVQGLDRKQAASEESNKAQDARISENRSRIVDVEKRVGAVELDVAGIKPKRS